ncbi:flagellar hook-basal body complex protein FliE [Roseicitreum antarcticum]|uniref:Flagellar hook-basal body complex protein FliE n=1 Tax=Roseicitreum antarcticum TaxID=564137 RepID=A0A1H3A3F7_9RHOB|nr:flagellar hook-basal body complex protein FliE [Roseicitreum antarcticum]SDX23744.1 flagellar hook-basal body complex protein FliE [Roseicitreum antarcticum]
MQISPNIAAQSYGAARPVTAPEPLGGLNDAARSRGFQDSLGRAATSFVDTLRQAETTAEASMMGGDADPHALVMALARTQGAVETTIAVRDKVVEAYLEILRMPV